MVNSDKLVYPAFIQQDDEGIFCVYFPTLFPESGWDFPLSRGETKREAIKNAKKDLAYSLSGILYDNEELPEPIPINSNDLSEGMELIDIDTSDYSHKNVPLLSCYLPAIATVFTTCCHRVYQWGNFKKQHLQRFGIRKIQKPNSSVFFSEKLGL